MRKYKTHIDSNEQAVSAVIAVILMLAVTVVMGAVSFAYFTGMIGGTNEVAPLAVINIEDGADTADAGGMYAGGNEVFKIVHYSGELIIMSECSIEYKGGAIASWTTLTDTGAVSGLEATLPANSQFGNSISVTAVDGNTQDGPYSFRIRHNPSDSWILHELTATAI